MEFDLKDWLVHTTEDGKDMGDKYEVALGGHTIFSVDIPHGQDNARQWGRREFTERFAKLLTDQH